MPPLGVEVRNRTAPPARGGPTTTDTWFVAGQAGSGPTDRPVRLTSLTDFTAEFGARATANQAAFDALDAFFREGGRQAYFARYADDPADGLDLFERDLGAGQVSIVGDETPGAALYGTLLDHAAARNRFAVLDVGNGDTVAAMTTLGGAIPAGNGDYGALFGPWAQVPGPAGTIGAGVRTVPASAVVAALCARADALGNPNRAPAGRDFPLQYTLSYASDVSEVDRAALLDAGVNTFATKYGVLQLRGFQTGIEQNADNPFWQANCVRARMWLTAQAEVRGESYLFKPIDGRGLLQMALRKDLETVLLDLFNVDGLFGADPQDAFSVEVGVSVNAESAIAQGELHAVAEARFSLHTKRVLIDLVSVPITGRVTTAAA